MFKPTYTRTIPRGSKTREVDGQQQVCLNHGGKQTWFPVSIGGRARVPHTDWHGRIKTATGERLVVRLCRDKTAAETMLREMQKKEDRILAGLDSPISTTSETVMELIERFIKHKKISGVGAKRIQLVEKQLIRFANFCKLKTIKDIRAINSKTLAGFVDSLDDYTNVTKGMYQVMVLEWLRWMKAQSFIPEVPQPLKISSKTTYQRRALSFEEVERLADVAGWPWSILYRLAFASLARLGALLALRPSDFHLKDMHLILRPEESKTGKGQNIPIPARLAKDLKKLVASTKGDQPVFLELHKHGNNFSRVFAQHLKLAGIPVHTPDGVACFHSLRHSGATHLAKSGVSLILLQQMGGWSDLGIVAKHYAHLSPIQERFSIDAAMRGSEQKYTSKKKDGSGRGKQT